MAESIDSIQLLIHQESSTEEFPILLSEVWEWLGYFDKSTATRSFLALEMAETIDFAQFLIDEASFQALGDERDRVKKFS